MKECIIQQILQRSRRQLEREQKKKVSLPINIFIGKWHNRRWRRCQTIAISRTVLNKDRSVLTTGGSDRDFITIQFATKTRKKIRSPELPFVCWHFNNLIDDKRIYFSFTGTAYRPLFAKSIPRPRLSTPFHSKSSRGFSSSVRNPPFVSIIDNDSKPFPFIFQTTFFKRNQ